MSVQVTRHSMALVALVMPASCCCCCRGLPAVWPPDSVSTGVAVRPIAGRNGAFRSDIHVPLVRIQANRRLTPEIDGYLRFDGINGRIKVGEGFVDREARGDMQVLGAGLRYTPFWEFLGLDVGAEVFHSDFAVLSRVGTTRVRVSDSAYGWALNAGASMVLPVQRRLDAVIAGGYSWSDNDSHAIHLNFDGVYWFFGLRLHGGARTPNPGPDPATSAP